MVYHVGVFQSADGGNILSVAKRLDVRHGDILFGARFLLGGQRESLRTKSIKVQSGISKRVSSNRAAISIGK